MMKLPNMQMVDYQHYSDNSKKLAIVIPLYLANTENYFPEMLIKTALWVSKSLVENSDITEQRIPIFYFIETPIWERYGHVFEDVGVSKSRIRLFDAPPHKGATRMRISKGFYMMRDEVLREYDCLIRFDADLFLGRADKSQDKFPMSNFIDDTVATMWYNPIADTPYTGKKWWWQKTLSMPMSIEDSFDRVKTIIESKLPERCHITRKTLYNAMSGGVERYPMSNLPPDFEDFIFELEPILGDEELLLWLWTRYSQTELPCLIDPCAWSFDDHPHHSFDVLRETDCFYWSHIYGDPTDEQYELWRQDVGI